ncbi:MULTISPECIES: peptidase inhibitor family I36 protein [unclassified Knoellia]|uniref:peptidase inhibitor family I36 protein n=1 Tax=Knoellia altitudinis TaxID=3404795 RepID=UPI003611428A
MTKLKKRAAVGASAVALLATGMSALGSPSAQAAGRDGVCNTGEVCFYYNSDFAGSLSDFTTSIADYGTSQPECYDFKGPGAGQGLCIKNQVASVRNKTTKAVTVYYNSGYGGSKQTIAAGASVNLNATLKNQNASHYVGTPPASSWASPVPSTAVITAREYYPSGGFHGAVDYAGFTGRFKSACTGTIDNIDIDATYPNSNAYGVSGSTNYLWVNCGGGIRMGYAHWYARDKPASFVVGAQVTAGQLLINVGNQGNSSGTHLHFEVRNNGTRIDGHTFLKNKGVTGLPPG